MLSNAAKKKIIAKAVKNHYSGKEAFCQDDYRQDCQIVMPGRDLLAVFDFKDAVLDSKRFKPLSYSIMDLVMNFTADENDMIEFIEVRTDVLKEPVPLFIFKDRLGGKYYIQKKILDLICYDPEDDDHAIYTGAKRFLYYYDRVRGELDAVIPPVIIREANDETD